LPSSKNFVPLTTDSLTTICLSNLSCGMNKLLTRRLIAFSIDYILILFYAGILFLSSLLLQYLSAKQLSAPGPVKGQLIGFFLLTLPVFLYFLLSEKSKKKGTIGKRISNILVKTVDDKPTATQQLFVRNFLKFLPWEIAHTGVHWVLFYSRNNEQTPLWVYILLIVPQLAIVFYIITIIRSKGNGSFYDKIAGTKISLKINSI